MSAPAQGSEAASVPDSPPAPAGGQSGQAKEVTATEAQSGKESHIATHVLPELAEASRQRAGGFRQLAGGFRQLANARQAADMSSSKSQLGSNTGHAAPTASVSIPIRAKDGDHHHGESGAEKEEAVATSSQNPVQVPNEGFRKFSETRYTRKAAPRALNMARLRPVAPPPAVPEEEKPTHFLAVPIASPTAELSDRHRQAMERSLTAMNPAGTRVILARSPRAVLRPEDIRSPIGQCQLKEVPEAERLDAALARCSLDPRPPLKRDADEAGGASAAPATKRVARRPYRLITRLALHPDVIVRICKYLPADGILALYSLSYDFYDAVNYWLRDGFRECAESNVPLARWVFDWRLPDYQHLAGKAPTPWPSMLTPAVREFLEKNREPQDTPEEANMKAYLESRGIDTSEPKGKEVSGAAVEYQRVAPTVK